MKKCTINCLVAAIITFGFIYIYDLLVHQVLLQPLYEETAGVWRPLDELAAMRPWVLIHQFLLALLATAIFKKCRTRTLACASGEETPAKKGCPIKSGAMCFGLTLGLILGLDASQAYAFLPIPGTLALAWFIAGLIKGIGIGLVLHIVVRATAKDKSCSAE